MGSPHENHTFTLITVDKIFDVLQTGRRNKIDIHEFSPSTGHLRNKLVFRL
jgi:hypothetical protein